MTNVNHAAYAAAAADPSVLAKIEARLIREPVSDENPDGCWWWDGAHVRNAHDRQTGAKGRGTVWAHGAHRYVHRVLWVAAHPGETPEQLDHYVCGRGADGCCNPAHLRPVTNAQNGQHRRGANRDNLSSGVRGVTWVARCQKWQVTVKLNGRNRFLGLYDDLADAVLVARVGRRLGMPWSEDDADVTPADIARAYSLASPAAVRNLDRLAELGYGDSLAAA